MCNVLLDNIKEHLKKGVWEYNFEIRTPVGKMGKESDTNKTALLSKK